MGLKTSLGGGLVVHYGSTEMPDSLCETCELLSKAVVNGRSTCPELLRAKGDGRGIMKPGSFVCVTECKDFMPKEEVMKGYKTVTASEGWQFKITCRGHDPFFTTSYTQRAGVEGVSFRWAISFSGQEHGEPIGHEMYDPDIELVEIAKPEAARDLEPVVSVGVFCPQCGRGQKCHVFATRATYKAFTCQVCSYRYEAKCP